jgi:hypothetical protein
MGRCGQGNRRRGRGRRAVITLSEINALTGRRLGVFDVPCPLRGPLRRPARTQRKPVLRISRTEAGFATFNCPRCGGHGFARDCDSWVTPSDPARLGKARAETAERDRACKAKRQKLALCLCQRRRPSHDAMISMILSDPSYRRRTCSALRTSLIPTTRCSGGRIRAKRAGPSATSNAPTVDTSKDDEAHGFAVGNLWQ